MLVAPLAIAGAATIKIEQNADARGFFARTFCRNEFSTQGLPTEFVQSSVSHNDKRGTVRGMHFQWPPSLESKFVRCMRGRIFDVLLDLRPQSATYLKHEAVTLDADECNAVLIPAGVAHGFQTLLDDSRVWYEMTDFYAPELASGVRWDDKSFGIAWPLPVSVISDRDRNYPDFDRNIYERELAKRCAKDV